MLICSSFIAYYVTFRNDTLQRVEKTSMKALKLTGGGIIPETQPWDPFEPTLGLRHRDISHLLEILSNPQAPKASKIKSLHLLIEVIPGRQHEADQKGAIDILRPFLMQEPNGLLLNTLVVFNALINTKDLAQKILDDVPRIVELVHPEMEKPIRVEAARLLRVIAEYVGPEVQFQSGSVPSQLVAAVASRDCDTDFLLEGFRLLSRITNKQNIRVPLIDNNDFLLALVRSFSNQRLREAAFNLAANIAMDPSHRGKLALLNAEILTAIEGYLTSEDAQLRLTTLSLLALLAVPKDGKQMIATDPELPEMINNIARNDSDEKCKKAALGLRVLVMEHPIGQAILGSLDDDN